MNKIEIGPDKYKHNAEVKQILDKLIEDNPDEFEKAKKQYSHIDWFVRLAMEATNRRMSPMIFSQAMRRKLEEAGTRWDEDRF